MKQVITKIKIYFTSVNSASDLSNDFKIKNENTKHKKIDKGILIQSSILKGIFVF